MHRRVAAGATSIAPGDRRGAGAGRALLGSAVGVEERLEDPLALFRQQALALIVDLEEQPQRIARQPEQHVAAVGTELDGVVQDVGERLPQLALVAVAALRALDHELEVHAPRPCLGAHA